MGRAPTTFIHTGDWQARIINGGSAHQLSSSLLRFLFISILVREQPIQWKHRYLCMPSRDSQAEPKQVRESTTMVSLIPSIRLTDYPSQCIGEAPGFYSMLQLPVVEIRG